MTKLRSSFIPLSLAAGLLFWILDSLIDVYLLDEGTLIQQLFAPDPTEIWERIVVLSLLLAQGFYMSKTSRDKREQQNKLADSDELVRELFRATPSCVKLVDLKGHIMRINRAGLAMLEFDTEDAIIGRNVFDFIHPDRRDSFLEANRRTLAGETVTTTFKVVGTSGRILPVRSTIEPFRDASGEVVGTLAVTSDITKELEEDTNRHAMEDKLHEAQKLEGLNLLAGGVAHDFNNILVGIMGYADLAARATEKDSSVHKYCNDILSSSSRAAELCTQLLAYTGKQQFGTETVNLGHQIQTLKPVIEGANLKKSKITYTLSRDAVIADVDPVQFNQILINLVLNALEAVPEDDGEVIVSTRITLAREAISLPVHYGEITPNIDYATICVTDNGKGMTATEQTRIFEPFYSSKEQGRGLGLAAVTGFVRSTIGGIHVYSVVNEGTTFTMLIPLAKETIPEPVPEPSIEMQPSDHTILLIDDEDIVRKVTQGMLQKAGAKTIVAHNGRDGIQTFEKHQNEIDLVLVDYAMPGLNGFETMKQLKEIQADIPVILISGYSNDDHALAEEDSGFAATLQKPFTYDKLLQVVHQVLASENVH